MEDVRRLEEMHRAQSHQLATVPPPITSVSLEVPTTRVYAHVTAETQVALRESFGRVSNPLNNQYQYTQPVPNPDDNAYLEVFPRSSSRQPHLLQHLELLLQDKLHKSEKLASPYGPGHRDPAVAANLRFGAHRDVWEAFIQSFGTYRPLMASIKEEYDNALQQALVASAENVSMRTQLAEAEERKVKSMDQARAEVMASTSNIMLELRNRLMATEERAVGAEARAAAYEKEAKAANEAADTAKADMERARQMYDSMSARKQAEQKWLSKPGAKNIVHIEVGPCADGDGDGEEREGEEAVNVA
mmetsp:Transcript_28686/g.80761  ORF Transcript_28686/g.80761 Transcript_28686/m.80761 type:complete len:303 (+) Transcript_28686:92-1000(+)|eukprot:CAMPEP_0117659526 /NCGR_PEP_ID=MMETSP0804-20121206/6481_1 /TAXON_ID=1074897 /ORGANISM="Tetraselmis astigmatica, Strain CCMP880" /LENGTH=302 /DNA_ID=CAMNT_0005466193 /DNA_START=24 /DNA_END=932 /DNA_ORIENTATION=+